jgi:uncharacterized protein YycO
MIIKPADLILVRGTGWISKAIEDVEHSPYSHVGIVIKPNEIIEAEGFRRTGYNGLDAYRGMADVYTCDEATDQQRQQIVDYLIKKVGTHYCYRLLAWEYIRYKTGIQLPFDPGPYNRICSYLATDAYTKNGLNLWPRIRFPTPGDVPGPLRLVGSI